MKTHEIINKEVQYLTSMIVTDIFCYIIPQHLQLTTDWSKWICIVDRFRRLVNKRTDRTLTKPTELQKHPEIKLTVSHWTWLLLHHDGSALCI